MTAHLVTAARTAAAVTGRFTLEGLCRAIALPEKEAEARALVWRDLAALSTEEPDAPEGYAWSLGPDARRGSLQAIFALPQLDLLMRTAPPAVASATARDQFGLALQQILRRQRIAFDDPGRKAGSDALRDALRHLAAILDAVQFAEAVPALKGVTIPVRMHHDRPVAHLTLPQLKELGEAKVKELQARHDIRVVLPDQHFGYTSERRAISGHVRGTTDDPRPLLLTGVGGAGKSALLSRLMLGWRRSEPAMILVLLDFDRRQLNAGEPIEIVTEILRQVIAAFGLRGADPADPLLVNLHKLRRDLALFKTSTLGGGRETNAQQASDIRTVLRRVRQDWAAPLRETRIALILDTFEAVDRMAGFFRMVSHERGERPPENAVVTQIMDMLGYIQRDIFPQMRVVVSGREEPLTETELNEWFGTRLRLRGVSAISGAKILRAAAADAGPAVKALFRDEDKARRVSHLLDGHPLALLAFVRYAADNPTDIDALIADLETRGGFQAEFAQVFLYRRILDRITDPKVQALAHPGLMLRRIDREAIQKILAWACLDRDPLTDGAMPDDEADELFERLRNQYWLVQPDEHDKDAVRHVPDLRRLMLDGLLSGPARGDDVETAAQKEDLRRRALVVCDLAHHLYAIKDDPARQLDAMYYRSFTTPAPASLDTDVATRLELHLGEDVDTMPIDWRARLKVTLGVEPTPEEAATLDAAAQEQARTQAYQRARQTGFTTVTTKSGRPPPVLDFSDDAARAPRPAEAPPAAPKSAPVTDPSPLGVDLSIFGELLKKTFGGRAKPEGNTAAEPAPPPAGADDPFTFPDDSDPFALPGQPEGSPPEDDLFGSPPSSPQEAAERAAPEPSQIRATPAELAREFEYLWGSGELHQLFGTRGQSVGLGQLLWPDFAAALLDQVPQEGDAVFATDLQSLPLTHPVYIAALTGTAFCEARPTKAPPADADDTFATPMGTLLYAIRAARAGRREHAIRAMRHYAGHFREPSVIFNRFHARQVATALARPDSRDGTDLPVEFSGMALAAGRMPHDPRVSHSGGPAQRAAPLVVLKSYFERIEGPELTLSDLERIYRESTQNYLDARDIDLMSAEERQVFARLLRGLNPELAEPAASLLGTCDPKAVEAIVAQLSEDQLFWPVDLRFGDEYDYEAALAPTIVETADRCGVLRDLLVAMAAHQPLADELVTVYDAITAIWFTP